MTQNSLANFMFKQSTTKLADYAVNINFTKGRKYTEDNFENTLPYQIDRMRIINSIAFRRLEYKTQVFMNYIGDHYRTRLTHSLEVAQVARLIAFKLNLNEDLTECIALAHDLGHPPFGHAGEDALQSVAAEFGGFDHNAQTLKIITQLEQNYINFNGLNLTWETLEGIAKHNGPLLGEDSKHTNLHKTYHKVNSDYDLKLNSFPSLEAQAASLADDIAYICHDIDDGYRAGFIDINDLIQFPIVKDIINKITYKQQDIRLINEIIIKLREFMLEDLINATKDKLKLLNIKSSDEVREQKELIVEFSQAMEGIKNNIKRFLFKRIYSHYKVNKTRVIAAQVINELYSLFFNHPNCMPNQWQSKIIDNDPCSIAEVVIDYIAGMTDRYAIQEYKKLFDPVIY